MRLPWLAAVIYVVCWVTWLVFVLGPILSRGAA